MPPDRPAEGHGRAGGDASDKDQASAVEILGAVPWLAVFLVLHRGFVIVVVGQPDAMRVLHGRDGLAVWRMRMGRPQRRKDAEG